MVRPFSYNCKNRNMDNFDLLHAHMHAFCEHAEREFAGALLRPHGPALKPMMEKGAPIDDIFEAAKEAGRQLVEDAKMSPETLAIVSRELLPLEMWVRGTG
jgi:hypothetical protein